MEEECQVEVRKEERGRKERGGREVRGEERKERKGRKRGEGRREGGRKGRRGEVEDEAGRRRVDVVDSLIHLSDTILIVHPFTRKMQQCKKSLMGNLFILHPKLRPALLKVRAQCEVNCESKLMAAIDPATTYTLEEFKTVHIGKMGLVGNCIS